MAKPVRRPQREVILRKGPLAGVVKTLDEDATTHFAYDLDGNYVCYTQDPELPDYFVWVPHPAGHMTRKNDDGTRGT